MPKFNPGDIVTLGPTNTGQPAFTVLSKGTHYVVEKVGNTCSSKGCQDPAAGTVRIVGHFFCGACFVMATKATQGQQKTGSGVQERSGDPARSLYSGSVDWLDTLPDVTQDEQRTLPTLQDLDDKWWKERGYPNGSPTKRLP